MELEFVLRFDPVEYAEKAEEWCSMPEKSAWEHIRAVLDRNSQVTISMSDVTSRCQVLRDGAWPPIVQFAFQTSRMRNESVIAQLRSSRLRFLKRLGP